MGKYHTTVVLSMLCLLLEKSNWVSCNFEGQRNRRSNDVRTSLREKRQTTCADYFNYQTCYNFWRRGQCYYYSAYCRKTCGFCKVQPVTKPAISTNCRNIKAKSQCDNWVISKYCTQTYASWMKTNCASSCGHCVCKDNNNQCASWARTGECQKNPKYMLLNCQKSCAVCRPKGTKKPVTKPKPTPKPTRKPTRKATMKPTTVAKRTCGHSLTADTRIVGGTFAHIGQWPWHAALTTCRNCTDIPFCGGTLINNKWVVTAAHCLTNVDASHIYILLGETNVRRKSRHEVVRKVRRIRLHPDYAIDARYDYDIAMLELEGSVKFTYYVQPACLPPSKPKLSAGRNCTVTGFGRTAEKGSKSSRLKQAIVPLVSHSQCKKVVGSTGFTRITSNMLCAGHAKGGIDACQGDSGGPLVCKSSDGSYELAGVVSWGRGCARANQYGVYADMQVLRGWVESVIAGRSLSRTG